MNILLLITVIVLGSVGFVVYLLFKEKNPAVTLKIEKVAPEQIYQPTPIRPQTIKEPSSQIVKNKITALKEKIDLKRIFDISKITNFVNQLTKKKTSQTAKPSTLDSQMDSLKMRKNEPQNLMGQNQRTQGTASLRIDEESSTPSLAKTGILSKEEEKTIEQEMNASLTISELKEKLRLTEKLLQEKSAELDTIQQALNYEKTNRKEFNKVKDLLEKELSDSKDRAKQIQAELTSALSEKESYKKRIVQLEEKVTRCEKEILEKEKRIEELAKSLNELKNTAQRQQQVQSNKIVAIQSVDEKSTITPSPANPTETNLSNNQEKEEFLNLKPDVVQEKDDSLPKPNEGNQP